MVGYDRESLMLGAFLAMGGILTLAAFIISVSGV